VTGRNRTCAAGIAATQNWPHQCGVGHAGSGIFLSAGKSCPPRADKVIPQLAKAVSKQLDDLGFKQGKFAVALTRGDGTGRRPAWMS